MNDKLLELNELLDSALDQIEFKDGFWEKQKAVLRASTDQSISGRKKGGNSIIGIRNPDMVKENLKGTLKGMGKGGAAGIGIGSLAGLALAKRGGSRKKLGAILGAAVGGSAGSIAGSHVGGYKADQKYLAKKGVKISRGGFKTELTPAARKKYITDYNRRNAKNKVREKKRMRSVLDDLRADYDRRNAKKR